MSPLLKTKQKGHISVFELQVIKILFKQQMFVPKIWFLIYDKNPSPARDI